MTSQAIQEISNFQESILSSIDRMCWTLFETEHVGLETVDKLQAQREQTDRIHQGLDRVEWEQNKAKKMLGTLGSMQCRYGTHSAAKREVRTHTKTTTTTTPLVTAKVTRHSPSCSNNQRSSQQGPNVPSWQQPKRLSEPSSPKSVMMQQSVLDQQPQLDPYHRESSIIDDELRHIAATDEVIDQQLDTLAMQLDTIVTITKTVAENVSSHSADLNKLQDRNERVRTKQMVLNRRVRRFLQGKFRKQCKIQDSSKQQGSN